MTRIGDPGPSFQDRPTPPTPRTDPATAATRFGDVLGARDTQDGGHTSASSSQAKIFNADGFFRSVRWDDGQGVPLPTAQMAPDVPLEMPLPPTADVPVRNRDEHDEMLSIAPAAASSAPAGLTSIDDGAAPMPLVSPGSTARTQGAMLTAAPIKALQAAVEDTAPLAPTRGPVARPLAGRGAVLATRVALAALDHGIQLSIRVDQLDRDERVRLRDRVAALLSRHGLVSGDIRINGMPGDRPAGNDPEGPGGRQ